MALPMIVLVSVICELIILPFYFLSLNHTKLQNKLGKSIGNTVGSILGIISGWGFFLFLFGIWLGPQQRFVIPILVDYSYLIPFINIRIYLFHLIIFLPLIGIVNYFSIRGVNQLTIKVSSIHRADKLITNGIYAKVRHPQYFGAVLSHIAISILLNALISLLLTPFIFIYVYILCIKEEFELIKEFGDEYNEYKKKVPRLWPKLINSRSDYTSM